MKKLVRFAAIAAASIGLAVPAIVSAQTATVSTSGPNSKAKVSLHNKNDIKTDVKNDIKAKLSNNQKSTSGNAKASENTTVGDVGTGNASADNS